MNEASVANEIAPSSAQANPSERPSRQNGQLQPPVLSLPKGGGAIRGIGEKFSANPVTGTGSMVVPIATSPGRSGFGPELSLTYDSGAGNGPFGFGWQLSTPAITRKTNQGIPRYVDELPRPPTYKDTLDPDVFILSGVEDLVPVFRQDPDGSWIGAHPGYSRDDDGGWVRDSGALIIHEDERDGYRIRRYRPRVEGLFARIERWTNLSDVSDVHWRSISNNNILTIYGSTSESRITDPTDDRRIFSWLICEARDDKGNAVIYRYRKEDSINVRFELAHERNRGPRDDPRRAVNRYLKRIQYGNTVSLLNQNTGLRPHFLSRAQIDGAGWVFEVIFDYGDHHPNAPTPRDDSAKDAAGQPIYPWPARPDPFSTYRSGFEIRTMRRCKRVLMLHHFPGTEPDGVGTNCLVKSTDFLYSDDIDTPDPSDINPRYSFLRQITHSGYRRDALGGYHQVSLPPLELEYSQPIVQQGVEDVAPDQLTHLPVGLDNNRYIWTDLHGEGIPGILTEQAGTWFYQRNLSPDSPRNGQPDAAATFAPLETVAVKPSTALAADAAFMDLAGDGLPDLVAFSGATPGLFEHDDHERWKPFRPFTSRLNRDIRDPNLRLVDLVGDGRADALVSERDGFIWHESLAEAGFGPGQRTPRALDEELGPLVIFADANQSVFLGDMSGDGLTDIVRIREGEVCYWPNLGYGRFGPKVTMDHAPDFTQSRALDDPDRFDPRRIRLTDIDGSGTTDIIYLHPDGVRLYFNQSGNSWGQPQSLHVFPPVHELATIAPVDLLGTGTACLVWSSPSPAETSRQMRYVKLMSAGKPHLLVRAINNLGAETRVHYAPSTKFYLRDKRIGKPWTTRLPFPVHVVERVETVDYISRNRFTTRYSYHHGYFDGNEREFRGFAMVEQWDSEELDTLAGEPQPHDDWSNTAPHSHVPPVHTKTWFHTGIRNPGGAAAKREYYREEGLTDTQADALLLPDTVIPTGLTPVEEYEATRALKGATLRREVYADDAGSGASADQVARARRPYLITEQNFAVRVLQRRGANRHGVFFTHPEETITYHHERSRDDSRVQHVLTLNVDDFGNIVKQVAIGYGRRRIDAALPTDQDRNKQRCVYITATENTLTNPIIDQSINYRGRLPAESRTYEVRRPTQELTPVGPTALYRLEDIRRHAAQAGDGAHDIDYEDFEFRRAHQCVDADPSEADKYFRRLIDHSRTLYRSNSLDGLLQLGVLESLALTGESYKLAFTPGLLRDTFRRPRPGQPTENLIPDPSAVLASQTGDGGGYLRSKTAKDDGRFPNSDPNDYWWIPAGRVFYSSGPSDAPITELSHARLHFFLPRRYENPLRHNSIVDYDGNDLVIAQTCDDLENRTTADAIDYRVLQPRLVSDPNRNRTEVAFDTLGMVVGTAIMGKSAPVEGDSLAGFIPDLTPSQLESFVTEPRRPSGTGSQASAVVYELLADATSRFVYDLQRFRRTRQAHPDNPDRWEPTFAATVVRETHVSDLDDNEKSKLQVGFEYSDGFGRAIQRKVQAEPGPLADGGPRVNPRWIGSGWTVYNNKGLVVRQYEPFFTATHSFEFGAEYGVSAINFYDPLERIIATLYPNHTYHKAVLDPWQETIFDTNDTSAARNAETGDPRTDPDIRGYVSAYFAHLAGIDSRPWHTWYAQRAGGARGTQEQTAAIRAASHADTPATSYFDALGRTFLTKARNRVVCDGHDENGNEASLYSRVDLDIEGNARAVRDAVQEAGDPLGRIVTRYTYDMAGTRIHQINMDAGARWMLEDVAAQLIRAWDSRGHNFTTSYDSLRRLTTRTVRGTTSDSDQRVLNQDVLIEKIDYGEPPLTAAEVDKQRAIELNLRTRLYRHRDSAGITTNAALDANDRPTEAYDFKGNVLRTTRCLVADYTSVADWNTHPPLEPETFETRTRYDALNRPIQSVAPHSSKPHLKRNVSQNRFNDANLLTKVDIWLELDTEPADLINPTTHPPSPVGVAFIDYNAKGQRRHIDYKNGASTHFGYDPSTFQLVSLYSRRGAGFTGDCDNPQPPPDTIAAPPSAPPGNHCGLQNLQYTYDAAGNITHIHDHAQQAIFFNNRRVEPSNDYTYDALYRLIQATGREHLGQVGAQLKQPTAPDALNEFHTRQPHPGDGLAMGTYLEQYVYDEVENLKLIRHRGSDPANAGWTRAYSYNEVSLVEKGVAPMLLKTNNRLSRTQLTPAQVDLYHYDSHGNTTYLPHLGGGAVDRNMQWDYENRLWRVDLGAGSSAHFVYDASGQRVRKIWNKSPGPIEERIYIGAFEIHRTHTRNNSARTVTLERETLHVMDGSQRIALVETRTLDTAHVDRAPQRLIRYQLANHLRSSCVELDHEAQIISYEEYAPYGSSTYQAVRSATETPKRYRYTAKEHDEETGLAYYGARYYATWLGRWTKCDPLTAKLTTSSYEYAKGNPVCRSDPDGNEDKDFFKVDDQKTDGERKLDALGLALPVIPIARGLFATLTGQVSTDYLVPGIGSLAIITDETPRFGYKAAETIHNIAKGEGKAALRSGIDAAVHGQNVGFAVLPFLSKLARSPKPAAPPAEPNRAPAPAAESKAPAEGKPTPEAEPAKTEQKGSAGAAPPVALLTDAQLLTRARQLAGTIAEVRLSEQGKPVTEEALVGQAKSLTVAVLEGVKDGKSVRLVAVNNPAYHQLLKAALLPGEELVDPIRVHEISEKSGKTLKGGVDVHAEQVVALEATNQKLTEARVATSNLGCDVCVGTLTEHYPGIRHVNPKTPP